MGRRKDYTGMKFGRWTVLGRDSIPYISPKGVKRTKWVCKCDCGNERSIVLSCSVYGKKKTTQCVECANKGFSANVGFGDITSTFWTTLCRNAAVRKIEVNISPQYAWDLYLEQNRRCALTGITLSLPSKHVEKWHTNASIDRIDSSKHYDEGNVQWIHKTINMMKRSLSVDEFVDMCHLVSEYAKKEMI